MSLQNIKNFIIKNKKTLLFVVFFTFLFSSDFTFAGGDSGSSGSDNSNVILDGINAFVKIASILLGVITNFVGWFMTPSWTNGTGIGINAHLKDLWIMVSNIVYFIFAFILIWIALMNIIGKGGDWELKQALPRFIGGVLIVPFSWLLVGFMLSISSLFSVAILTLPQDSFESYDSLLDGEEFNTTFELNLASNGEQGVPPMKAIGNKITLKEYLDNSDNAFGMINTYTYSIMHIDSNGKLFSDDILKGINNLFDLTIKGIIDILFVFVYFLLMVALLMALFVRGVYIWIFMVISPMFGLMFFFKDKMPNSLENFTLTKFIGLALMPVYVSAALSFGLLFILVAGDNMTSRQCETNRTVCLKYEDKPKIEFLGFTLILKGGAFGSANDPERETKFKESFAQLVMQIFGLAVLRIAVMAALGSTKITETVVAPIKSFGDSVGKLAAAAPTYAPIIPSPGGGTMSARSLQTMGSDLQSRIDGSFTKKGLDASQSLFGGNEAINDMKRYMAGIQENTDPQIKANKYKGLLDKGLKNKSNTAEIEEFKKWMITMGLDKKEADKVITKTNMQKGNESVLAKGIWNNSNRTVLNKAGFQSLDDLRKYLEKLNKSTSSPDPEAPTTNNVKIEVKSAQTIDKTKITKDVEYSAKYLKDKIKITGEGTSENKIKAIKEEILKVKGTKIKEEKAKEIAEKLLKLWEDEKEKKSTGS